MWKDYLSKTAASSADFKPTTFVFSSGCSLSEADMGGAGRNSPEYEFLLLLKSETIFNWCKMCEVRIQTAFSDFDSNLSNVSSDVLINVDSKTVGCRFSLKDLEEKLRLTHPVEVRDKSFLEHCWVLSNSCGEVIDPLDVGRFKSLTFGKNAVSGEKNDDLVIGSSVGDYLSHAYTILERSKLPSSAGETRMKDDWVACCILYLSGTDLGYDSKEKNPLLTALVYELVETHHFYLSSYARNVKNFSLFLEKITPTIQSLWKFSWIRKPVDHRLLFDFSLSDLNSASAPLLSLHDMTVVLASKLVTLERLVHDSNVLAIRDVVDAILLEDNPSVDEGLLWIAFHCYYAQYRTAATRVQSRPDIYHLPLLTDRRPIVMRGVEKFFTTLQNNYPGMNVRRQFCGRMGSEAIALFKRLNLRFPEIAHVSVPMELAYLNLDYYKWINTSNLSTDEISILSKLQLGVDSYCISQLASNNGGNAQRPQKYKLKGGILATNKPSLPRERVKHVERTYDYISKRFARKN